MIFSETHLENTVHHPSPDEQKGGKSVFKEIRMWDLLI